VGEKICEHSGAHHMLWWKKSIRRKETYG